MEKTLAHLAPALPAAFIATPRNRSVQGTSVPDFGPVWMPPRAAAGAFQRNQNVPAAAVPKGVLADVCPGHRSWSPPV